MPKGEMGIQTLNTRILGLYFLSQLEWYAWVPNAPCTMRMPPPTTKEDVTMATVIGSLPDVQQSCLQMTITWHLGRRQPDMVRENSEEKN